MRTIALAVVLASIAGAAQAQECAGGRVATDAGYCCWPGQRWHESQQRCDGPPRCPPPLTAAGATCIGPGAAVDEPVPDLPDMVRAEGVVDYGSGAAVPAAPAARRSAPAAAVAAVGELGSGWPSAGRVPPAGPRNPRRETRSDERFQVGGIVMLGVGYFGAVATALGAFEERADRDASCHDAIGVSLLVPFVGGLFAWGFHDNCTYPEYARAGGVSFRTAQGSAVREPAYAVIGVLSSVFQLAGLGLILGGSFTTVEVTVFGGSARLSITPELGSTVGLRADLTF